jgi:hypothetical protein
MLLSLLAILGFLVVVLALGLHAKRTFARRRHSRNTAERIRLRLQDEPSRQRIAYREVPIRLNRN